MPPSLSVAGKVAIITGAGSGINYAFARLLLSKGCSVVIADLGLRPESEKLLVDYPHPPTATRPSAIFQRTDVSSWPQLSALFNKALASYPQVDIVVGGAGLFEPEWSSFWVAPKTATNPDSVSRDSATAEPGTYKVLDVNLTHPIRLSQLAIGYWTTKKMPGCIVHVSSIAGHSASVGTPLYFASKNGLHAFVRSLGTLRDDLGIRVSAVAPGSVRTPMWTEDPQKAAMVNGGADVHMTPEQVADAMLALCENPEYGNGTILECQSNSTRVVPLYNAPPPVGDDSKTDGFAANELRLVQKLKHNGLKV